MVVSILHRATGSALSVVGLALLSWWLMALAKGAEAYSGFEKAAHSPVGIIVLVGLTWSFFQHLLSGIRHLVTDTGAGFELETNKVSAIMTIIGSILLTAFFWAEMFNLFHGGRL
jgi:succinate dehydrogenase / fumarate reductase cytochrome b subunit